MVSVGDEITMCRGEKELVELLAELLGLPVAGDEGQVRRWVIGRSPFRPDTRSILARWSGRCVIRVSPMFCSTSATVSASRSVSRCEIDFVRLDPTSLARGAPVDLPIVADLRLAIADLTSAIRAMATASRSEIAEERARRARAPMRCK